MTQDSTVTIEIDGRPLQARSGAMLIEVADGAEIPIPRFCYHKKLSIAANCRMCLVEVENAPKPMPACATPVTDGMKVHTRSPKALAAQRGTMEFLLINHPLDCPICDQGGECELQDVAMGYGSDISRYVEGKRVVADKDIGPLIATDMTRCIHCTRCVRFGEEIAGLRELGATGRGEHTLIGTYVEKSIDSELSGNVIDLCPVGALTSKPFRFKARAWELIQVDGVAPHDSVGSNLHLHLRNDRVMRVHPRENEAINETWISDRDRFSYQGLYSADRLTRPLIKEDGSWREVGWELALEMAAVALREPEADQVGALVSPSATLEELYLAQKLLRGLGSGHVDSRLRQGDFRLDGVGPAVHTLGTAIEEIDRLQAVLLIGSNIRKEQPILAHRLRKAALNGAQVSLINPLEVELTFSARQQALSPHAMVEALAALAKALGARPKGALGKLVSGARVDAAAKAGAAALKGAERGAVWLGGLAEAHADFSLLFALAAAVAEASGARLGLLPAAANSVGAALAGAQPHLLPGAGAVEKPGLNALEMLRQPRSAYLLMGVEPGLDFWDAALSRSALTAADTVVALSPYRGAALEEVADILLPTAGFAETSGTFVNAAASWQSFRGAVAPPGEARPAWKVLRVLGNLLDLEGFDYVSSEQIRDQLQACCSDLPAMALKGEPDVRLHTASDGLSRVGEVPLYARDPLVRRATALQQTKEARPAEIRLNPMEASRLGLDAVESAVVVQDGQRARLPLELDRRVPEGCAWIPAGLAGVEMLGGQFADLRLERE